MSGFLLRPGWMREYQAAWLGNDVIAGLTAAAVVLPKALAYATIAGLPVEVGLYTALVPMVISERPDRSSGRRWAAPVFNVEVAVARYLQESALDQSSGQAPRCGEGGAPAPTSMSSV
jgi:hypothetical protein